jgi:PBP1b-binding outer membrane lipoprotein LpoB
MRKHNRTEMEGMIQRYGFLILIAFGVFFMSGCAATAPKSTAQSSKQSPVTNSDQQVAITGDLTLIASGFLPAPVLQAEATRYRLEITNIKNES